MENPDPPVEIKAREMDVTLPDTHGDIYETYNIPVDRKEKGRYPSAPS